MDLYRQATAAGRDAQAVRRAEARRNHADDDRSAELPRDSRRRAVGHEELRSLAMRTIKTTTGASVPLDGDLLAIMEVLYREVTAKRELNRSFEDMTNEINHLIDQMDDVGAARLPARESLPQHGAIRERQARGVHEEDFEITPGPRALAPAQRGTRPTYVGRVPPSAEAMRGGPAGRLLAAAVVGIRGRFPFRAASPLRTGCSPGRCTPAARLRRHQSRHEP